MAFSTLLACLRVDKPNADLLAVVRETAERHRSAVIGLVAKQAEAHAYAGGAGPVEPPGHDLHRFMERAAAAEQEFREALSPIEPLDWRAELTLGPAYEHVANEARGADLVIAPLDQNDRHMFPSGQPEVGDLLMSLGRPLLAVPAGAGGLKLNASLVCWKESREARRAVADALPMLQASRRVDVVEIVPTKATGSRATARRRRRRLAGPARCRGERLDGARSRNGGDAACSNREGQRRRSDRRGGLWP